MGFRQMHSTKVGLVLNLLTSSILPQHNVVFDDMLSTVVSITASYLEVWIRLSISSNSWVQFMLYQEDDTELDDEWLTSDEGLTRFCKDREQIVGRFKGEKSPSVRGPQYYEEGLVVRERVTSRTEGASVREPGTDGNHAPIAQSQNDGSSYSQDIPVPMENVRPEGNEDLSVTYPSVEALVRNVHVRSS